MNAAPSRTLSVAFWLVIAFLFFPVLVVLPLAVGETETILFPPRGFTLRWLHAFVTEERWVQATLLSARVALAAAVLATGTGLLAAVALARHLRRARGWLEGIMVAPLIVPGIVFGLGAYILFARLRLIESEAGLVALHAVLGLPYALLIIGAGLAQTDETLERAARICGAGPIRAFTAVTLPALKGPLVAAFLFAFFVSFDELAASLFVMGAKSTLPMLIWADLRLQFNPVVNAAAAVLIILSVAGLTLAEFLRRPARANP
ncbi:MAG TPA: ABC transporter permease [Microvirga sp.]|jgi:putative spermidine/putrescine transport system permease protein